MMMDDLEKNINERLEGFKPPFSDDSARLAKAKVFARTIDLEEEREEPTKVIPLWKNYRVAATIAILIAIPFTLSFIGEKKFSGDQNAQICELPDGSTVELSDGSQISFNEIVWGLSREVELTGEAHFKVAKGEVFTVETSHGLVEVLGTEFTVWENEDALVVHCSEGKVKVESVTIGANEYVVLDDDEHRQGLWKNEEAFITTSHENLDFESTPLCVVVEVLEEKFNRSIELKSTEEYIFSGSLNSEDLDQSLQLLTKPFGLEVAMNRGIVVILDSE